VELELSGFLSTLEESLLSETFHKNPSVQQIVQYLLNAGGKRVRVQLVYYGACFGGARGAGGVAVGAEARAGIQRELVSSAVAVELCHLGSLYHDDIMDNSKMRRNVATTHIKYGDAEAIIAGDLLFARSARLANTLPTRAREIFAEAFERMCDGQISETLGYSGGGAAGGDPVELSSGDLAYGGGGSVDGDLGEGDLVDGDLVGVSPLDLRNYYFEVAEGKTAALIEASLALGGICAGAPDETVEKLITFGNRVGIAYQLIDDIIDIKGTSSNKQQGVDIQEGVQSIVIILLRESVQNGSATETDRKALKIVDSLANCGELIESEENSRKLEYALELIRKSRVFTQAENLAKEFTNQATSALNEIETDNEQAKYAKNALSEFANKMLSRIS
jgi:heptaprenyl diphosphate synthase